jgi:GT2 family glycosyltransferase
MKFPWVTVVVLNWNGCQDTLACLASLSALDYAPLDVILVDNGSTDGSVAAVRASFPEVRVLETGENLGFAEGNNVGLRHALAQGADYVLLLNNDTEVASDLVSVLVSAVESTPRAGVAGPTVYYFGCPTMIWSAGGAIDWRRGDSRMMGLDEEEKGQYEAIREVDFVTGCALLARCEVVEKAGLFDPRFFMYYEETEWCVRAARAGYKVLHVPQARIWHKIAPVQQAASPRIHYYMTRNRLLFLRSTRAGVRAWLHTLLAEYLRTLASWTLQPRWHSRRVQRGAMIRAIADFARGHFGPAPHYLWQNSQFAGRGDS